ncbi:hypothetical protein M6D81_26320 [Paenibacillus sp. J5C_2022]|uniref:hypothetical protein n=1 Tax=Paenibacillus sp. J5C2022 TaxID=2977129 RepID=UPI0021CFFDE7|nr:hypothetical protein [Paenibacillus sp. J5C2022]MCU6712221.1 hypothetical protein [Paenibacillus sp. J5C2022]
MMHQAAIMFDFSEGNSARMAYDMLNELGYDPVMHDETRLHIHVEGNDLTSALEIAQSHGGRLVEQRNMSEEDITSSAYELESIAIPAHVVNEDLIQAEESGNLENTAEGGGEFLPDSESYNHFPGDVHI